MTTPEPQAPADAEDIPTPPDEDDNAADDELAPLQHRVLDAG